MLLYVIRHGEPDYATDSLTEKGKIQAEKLADRLCVHGFDEIYSSPLGRAKQTAQPTCDRFGMRYKIEDWMSEDKVFNDLSATDSNGERDWSFAGQNTKLVTREYTFENWYTNPVFDTCRSASGGYRRVSDSSDDFIARLGYAREGRLYKITAPNEKRVAAFCHHGLGTTWLSYMLLIPPNVFWSAFDIGHTGVTILEFKNNPDGYTAPKCLCLADVSHLL